MKKLFALLVAVLAFIGAVVVATLFYWRKNNKSWGRTWSSAKDAISSWTKSASDEAGRAAHKFSGVTSDAKKTAPLRRGIPSMLSSRPGTACARSRLNLAGFALLARTRLSEPIHGPGQMRAADLVATEGQTMMFRRKA